MHTHDGLQAEAKSCQRQGPRITHLAAASEAQFRKATCSAAPCAPKVLKLRSPTTRTWGGREDGDVHSL